MCSTDDLLINRYRNQLMGVATLGVLLVHSIDIVHWNSIIENIVGYGGVGVYIFVYLSAIGLFISLKTRGVGYKKFDFYKRRFQKSTGSIFAYCRKLVWCKVLSFSA